MMLSQINLVFISTGEVQSSSLSIYTYFTTVLVPKIVNKICWGSWNELEGSEKYIE